jgi:hypothetical protein
MGLISWFSSWFSKKSFGEVIMDFGELPSHLHSCRVHVKLRKIGRQPPYLQFKWELAGENRLWTSLACTPQVFARLETVIQESRNQLDKYMTQQRASPNGGPTTQPGSSGVSEVPPSVS